MSATEIDISAYSFIPPPPWPAKDGIKYSHPARTGARISNINRETVFITTTFRHSSSRGSLLPSLAPPPWPLLPSSLDRRQRRNSRRQPECDSPCAAPSSDRG